MKNIFAIALFLAATGQPCGHIPAPRPTPVPTQPAPQETPTASIPTPIPPPVEVRQLTSGKAVFHVDLSGFTIPAPGPLGQLDYFAFSTLLWDANDLHAPALELSIRGTENKLCERMPCGVSALGLVVRFSGDIKHDGKEPDEKKHCGSGLNYSKRLAIGTDRAFDVSVSWSPEGIEVETPESRAWLSKGAPRVGFGKVYFPLPSDRGIGWSRSPWLLQLNGGSATLLSWAAVGEQLALAECPAI